MSQTKSRTQASQSRKPQRKLVAFLLNLKYSTLKVLNSELFFVSTQKDFKEAPGKKMDLCTLEVIESPMIFLYLRGKKALEANIL